MFRSLLTRAKWAVIRFFGSQIDTLITKRLIEFYVGLERDGIIRHVSPRNSSQADRPLPNPSAQSDASPGHVLGQHEYTVT